MTHQVCLNFELYCILQILHENKILIFLKDVVKKEVEAVLKKRTKVLWQVAMTEVSKNDSDAEENDIEEIKPAD